MNVSDYEMVLIGIGEEFDNNEKSVDAYNKLSVLLADKNYFIVSLSMDDKIFESELSKDRIVAPLGGYRKKQCPNACENRLYEISEAKCSICGTELIYNNIHAENYIEEGYLPMWDKHKKWLTGTLNKKLLVVELGVSMRFPQIIRWPFERIVMLNNKAHMIRVNEKFPQLTPETADKGEGIKGNSVMWIIEN